MGEKEKYIEFSLEYQNFYQIIKCRDVGKINYEQCPWCDFNVGIKDEMSMPLEKLEEYDRQVVNHMWNKHQVQEIYKQETPELNKLQQINREFLFVEPNLNKIIEMGFKTETE